jgi:hypothetical protein
MSTLSQVGGLPDVGTGFLQPKQQNKWRVTFLQFGELQNTTPLSMQAKKLSRPNLTFKTHEIHRYNSVAKVAGKHEISDLSITFDDDIGSSVGKIIQAQLQRQQYIVGADGPFLAASQEGSMYKFATVLDLLNGNDLVLETWTYEGCMIKEYKGSELDYSNSDTMTIDLTISVDHMFQRFPNAVKNNMALGGQGVGG